MTGVLLGAADALELDGLYREAHAAGGSPADALVLAGRVGLLAPRPGSGSTLALWECLATLAAADLTVARVIEPHLDALAILAEARMPHPEGTWGVFAAESPGTRLQAEHDDGGWVLSGRKPWCSLGTRLDRALITAHLPTGGRRAFAVDLSHDSVRPVAGTWVSRGLAAVDSGPLDLLRVPAEPVGEENWYLTRDGFAWGGMGVASCWYGGAVGLARRVMATAREREPDQIGLMHLGAIDVALHRAAVVLKNAARAVDHGEAKGKEGVRLAARVRSVVVQSAEEILSVAAHAMGPGPLVYDEEHARRVADLQVYIRQHHAERDSASLGAAILSLDPAPW